MPAKDIHSGLTAERLRELLDYSPETGELRWTAARRYGMAGVVAGYTARNRYIYVTVDSYHYLAHRLVWLHIYGEWPVDQIDHLNGDRCDNRAANLRDVSQQVNQQNRRKSQRGSLSPGFLGVHFDRRRQTFIANIKDTTTMKSKYLGAYATAAEAHQAYLEAKRRLHKGCTL